MADPSKSLLRIGPFSSFDATTAGPYADPNSGYGTPGSGTQNVDTERFTGAMVSPRGRSNMATLSGTGNIQYLAHFNYSPGPERSAIASLATTVQRYNVTAASQAIVASGSTFTQAFQYGGDVMYTNAGQQIRAQVAYQAFSWAGWLDPSPSPIISGTLASGGNLVAGTYYYQFTTRFQFSDGTVQEGPPVYYGTHPNSFTLTGTGSGSLSGGGANWYGTAPDGSSYSTNIYRASSNQPTYYFAGNANSVTVGSVTGTFADNLSDATIASGQQLQFRFPDPIEYYSINYGSVNQPPIFRHKERSWIFMLFNGIKSGGVNVKGNLANPFGQGTYGNPVSMVPLTSGTQCQLWFSDAGIPWSFFAGSQVMLIGDDSDNSVVSVSGVVNYGNLLNDAPMGGVSLSSVGILHKRRSTWILYGDDPSTFLPRKMSSVGCVSSGSITICGSNGDIDAWLSEDGPQLCDGNSITYIGDAVREYLANIAQSDWPNSVGWYANRTWYLSFPATGVTMRYYLPKGKWLPPLPYAANAAYAIPSESAPVGNARLQEIVASEPTSKVLDYWGAVDATDLGSPMTVTWQSPLTDSGAPGITKQYQWISVNAPVTPSPGVILSATLVVDQSTTKTHTWQFDLSQGPTLVGTIPDDMSGYMAQLTLTASTVNIVGSVPAVPLVIYSAEVHGSVMRNLVASPTGVS